MLDQESLSRELLELIERLERQGSIIPNEAAMLRWACGLSQPTQPTDYPQMPLGWGGE